MKFVKLYQMMIQDESNPSKCRCNWVENYIGDDIKINEIQ